MNYTSQKQENKNGKIDRNFDQMVWLEVMRGCQLVQEVEQKLKLAPPGSLGKYSCTNSGMIRTTVIGAAAAIVTSFSNVLTFLNSTPSGVLQLPEEGTDHLGSVFGGELQPNCLPSNSSSPMSSTRTFDSTNSGTSPPYPQPTEQLGGFLHPSPPLCYTPTPPQSPRSTTTPAKKRSIPYPKPRSVDLGCSTSIRNLDVTADLRARLDVEKNNVAEVSMQGRSKLNVGSATGEHIPISKRRKYMPKWTVKVPGIKNEQGSTEVAPVDGFTWRKYGQKDILGSRHPRSYYRCTRKTELGCPAIKYVQKSDDDPPVFHVTYKGEHICQFTRSYGLQSYSYPIGSLQEPQSSIPVSSSCLTLSGCGSLHVGQFGPTSSTKNVQLGGQFVSSPLLRNSTENVLSENLVFGPTARFPVPEMASTQKFGLGNNFSNVPFKPKDFIGPMNPRSGDDSLLLDGFHQPKLTISQAQSCRSKQNENIKLTHGDIKIVEADEVDKFVRSTSNSLSRDTRKASKQNVKQLINHLSLDDIRAYDSSGHSITFESSGELFSPTASEVVSNTVTLEFHQRSFHDPKLKTSLRDTTVEGRPPTSESEISEVVAENVPSCKFDLDFVLDSPCSHQQMLDLQSFLFES
ncbi:hypothetical protein O6H91_05G131900 [Diphasiastrum complanatum]|uniref:Uncharacterized protein n=1 Tax=Diphasiastrum complanatum TaxID=34168 RepID=A0ACC2DTF3_DIPCM|nr:hypothetical protein O6H91_05G131900 [Diphasiastrum complanatum]